MTKIFHRIRNWDKWQTYRKDRGQPPWIKVHRALMRNPEWVSLTDAQKGQLVSIWLLAADRDGCIPADPKMVMKLCYLDEEPDLELFAEQGFIELCDMTASSRRQGDAIVTPSCRQHDHPETETEKEKRREEGECEGGTPPTPPAGKPALVSGKARKKSREFSGPIPDYLDPAAWTEFMQHRRDLRKPVTELAAKLIFKTLHEIRTARGDPNCALRTSVANGWTGVFKPKTQAQKSDPRLPAYSEVTTL